MILVKGYLSCNRFGVFLGLAHAAMTAEGDNSVLMQKVAKERLAQLSKSGASLEALSKPKGQDLSDPNYLVYLFQTAELKLFGRYIFFNFKN